MYRFPPQQIDVTIRMVRPPIARTTVGINTAVFAIGMICLLLWFAYG